MSELMRRVTRAAVLRSGSFVVDDVPLPELGPNQLRVRPVATGICGTDLSAWEHPAEFVETMLRFGAVNYQFDPSRDLVLGHEFTSVVHEVGSEVRDLSVGDTIFTLPVVMMDGQMRTVGFCSTHPGGLADEVVVDNFGHVRLDDDVNPVHAALLDPIATGVEAVRRADVARGQPALVVGAGPVGLGAVIEAVARGAYPVVVSEPSARRRALAEALGATLAVDPRRADPVEALGGFGEVNGQRLKVVEASGAAGSLGRLMSSVPRHTVIAVVGANAIDETIQTMGGTTANVTIIFASGPAYGEVRYEALYRAYDHLRSKVFDPDLLITAYTGLAGVAAAFAALRPTDDAIEQVKILVLPGLDTDRLLSPTEYRRHVGVSEVRV